MSERRARVARHRRHTLGIFLHRVHRWMGVVVSLFVILLVLTGWALNHTAELGLARISINMPWIAAWYGLRGAAPAEGYTAGGHWLISNENGTLLDGKELPNSISNAVGFVALTNFLALATKDNLFLLEKNGRLIDQIGIAQLPTGAVARIAAADDKIVLRGTSTHTSADGFTWTPFNAEAAWSEPQALPPAQREFANRLLPSLPLERLMQDVHSGRIFGRLGPYLMDAVGLFFLFLAATGLWMFFRHRRR